MDTFQKFRDIVNFKSLLQKNHFFPPPQKRFLIAKKTSIFYTPIVAKFTPQVSRAFVPKREKFHFPFTCDFSWGEINDTSEI